jgi:RNA polymerase sigma-70 factor (ECF subfamily)
MRVSRRQEHIDDVVNDTFWLVWRKAGEFRGASRVSTWIFGIAYRCTLRVLRRDRTHGIPLDTADIEELSTPGPQIDAEMRNWLELGLDQLTLDQRTTLQLAYYLGHSLEEIGEIMGCPVTTVKARMFHARVKLRALLPALGDVNEREIRASLG